LSVVSALEDMTDRIRPSLACSRSISRAFGFSLGVSEIFSSLLLTGTGTSSVDFFTTALSLIFTGDFFESSFDGDAVT